MVDSVELRRLTKPKSATCAVEVHGSGHPSHKASTYRAFGDSISCSFLKSSFTNQILPNSNTSFPITKNSETQMRTFQKSFPFQEVHSAIKFFQTQIKTFLSKNLSESETFFGSKRFSFSKYVPIKSTQTQIKAFRGFFEPKGFSY